MVRDRSTATLLGVAFLVVAVASLVSGLVLAPITGSGSVTEILSRVAERPLVMRLGILIDLVTSLSIVALGALLYVVFRERYRLAALLAFGWFLVEATLLAVSKLGGYALIPLSRSVAEAGASADASSQAIGDVLYHGVYRQGWDLHMLFFCAGAVLWYTLLLRSKLVPRVLAIWGVASMALLSVNMLWSLVDRDVGLVPALAAPYVPFEFVLGLYLIVRGFSAVQPLPAGARRITRGTS